MIDYSIRGRGRSTCFDIHIFLLTKLFTLSIFFHGYIHFSVGTVILRFVYYFIVCWVFNGFPLSKTDKCSDM